jgi:hypothetical protein
MPYYSTKNELILYILKPMDLLAIRVGGTNVGVASRSRQTRGGRLVACDGLRGLGRSGSGGGSGDNNGQSEDADGEFHNW